MPIVALAHDSTCKHRCMKSATTPCNLTDLEEPLFVESSLTCWTLVGRAVKSLLSELRLMLIAQIPVTFLQFSAGRGMSVVAHLLRHRTTRALKRWLA